MKLSSGPTQRETLQRQGINKANRERTTDEAEGKPGGFRAQGILLRSVSKRSELSVSSAADKSNKMKIEN